MNANYLIIFSSIFIRDAFSSLDNMIYQKLLYRGTLRNAIRRQLLQILIIVVIFGINAMKLIGSENDLFIGNNSKFALNQTMSLNHNSDIFWPTFGIKKTVKASLVDYAPQKLLDIKSKSVPIRFKGDNIISLYDFLLAKFPKKDNSFESADSYSKRIKEYPKNDFVFVLDSLPGMSYKYDPETQQARINYTFDIIKLKKRKIKRPHHSLNAFGVIIDDYGETEDCFGIFVMNNSSINNNFIFEIPIEEAKNSLFEIGMLFICKIVPISSELTTIKHDCVDYPESILEQPYDFFLVNVYVNEVWLYNSKTGRIYFKYLIK